MTAVVAIFAIFYINALWDEPDNETGQQVKNFVIKSPFFILGALYLLYLFTH